MPGEPEACDVAVLGGGPAGLAVAALLARRGRAVTVLERGSDDRPRAGETFGGELGPLLQALGMSDDFAALATAPFRGVVSAWGDAEPFERASLFHPFGEGWHVERAAFDRMLARAAVRAGAVVRTRTGPSRVTREGDRFRVQPAEGPGIVARFLVDASGRGAPATTLHLAERRWLRADRLVGLLGVLRAPRVPVAPVLLLEAVAEGWWYSAPQPDGALLAALMTDADLLSGEGRSGLARHFQAALARAPHTSARCDGAVPVAPPWIARADSGVLLPARGPGWCALGDAAFATDPLGGNGVARAVADALDAAPEIDRALAGEEHVDAVGTATARRRFCDYLEVRRRYYVREARWPDAPFWARRRGDDWQAAPLWLDPRRVLSAGPAGFDRSAVAAAEALVPPPALRALAALLHAPAPAHRALAALREAAPLEDRRLLVGLQALVTVGAVTLDDRPAPPR